MKFFYNVAKKCAIFDKRTVGMTIDNTIVLLKFKLIYHSNISKLNVCVCWNAYCIICTCIYQVIACVPIVTFYDNEYCKNTNTFRFGLLKLYSYRVVPYLINHMTGLILESQRKRMYCGDDIYVIPLVTLRCSFKKWLLFKSIIIKFVNNLFL